jgi:hypothetical protein
MTTDHYTDVRLVPITAEHQQALTSEDPLEILKAVRFVVQAYDKSPPLTLHQAIAYVHDVEWWRNEIADL